ncbi:HpcH/HpaI aldolase/citrate lyase family protein [Rhodococcoides kyotonense]|uniref:Citrate lyase subunit beta / citryl-CoA lyase n=1 Tax=Rhodococcoides kyotonense TaxID=398843 RepID=A0A239MQI1_9NOCA|nr:CoA ester lyase [Rhodococcus kyotonensis]SNT45006.1 citrate lyase subunit beta / citryl-CoA lyase [Rhodococcus kyotonensis]
MMHWTTLLFVPVTAQRFVETAHTRGADAVILDLEDSISEHDVPAALAALPAAVESISRRAVPVVVRIGRASDLATVVRPGVSAIMVPKVASAKQLRLLDADLRREESAAGITEGSIGVLALIEDPAAVFVLHEIASAPRVIGIGLGSEDFAAALGVEPTPAALTVPAQWVALAAVASGVMALGLPDTLANFRDLERLQLAAESARAVGMTGALCIHPAQVPVIDRVFAPSAAEVEWATAVTRAWKDTDSGVMAIAGTMIDKPVVLRAERILARRVTHV